MTEQSRAAGPTQLLEGDVCGRSSNRMREEDEAKRMLPTSRRSTDAGCVRRLLAPVSYGGAGARRPRGAGGAPHG